MIPKSGNRFPACAKPVARSVIWLDASAGEGRSEKIISKKKLERDDDSKKSHHALMSAVGLNPDIQRAARRPS